MMKTALCTALLAMLLVVDAQRVIIRNRLDPDNPQPPAGGGVGCNGSCTFSTSFTTAEGWTSDRTEQSCSGTGFFNVQSGVMNHGSGNPYCDMVTTAANYSGGAGGRGYRHPIASGDNLQGGGIKIGWPATNKFWMSYRVIYPSGMEWGASGGGEPTYIKQWYDAGSQGASALVFGYQGGGWGWTVQSPTTNHRGSLNWRGLMGGAAGDGQWHCFDWHFDFPNARAQLWIDGIRRLNETGVNFGGYAPSGTISEVHTSNQYLVAGTGGLYNNDYDDIRVDDDLTYGQRIGCPGSGG